MSARILEPEPATTVTEEEASPLDVVLEAMESRPEPPEEARSRVGRVIAVGAPESPGRVLVRWALGDRAVERWLPLLRGLTVAPGDAVLLDAPGGFPGWLVVGAIDGVEDAPEGAEAAAAMARELGAEVVVDGKRVEVEGADEVVLRCGQASITLRRNGRVVIRGTYVETRSKGVNRIRGGSVQIN